MPGFSNAAAKEQPPVGMTTFFGRSVDDYDVLWTTCDDDIQG